MQLIRFQLEPSRGNRTSALVFLAVVFAFLPYQAPGEEPEPGPWLTIDRLFDSEEFDERTAPQITWSRRANGYFTLEEARSGGPGKDFVRHDPETGHREIMVPAHAFVVPGESGPMPIDAFSLSDDESKVLLYTRSKRVWRRNTRGDYWVLDIGSRELRQLGGDASPSSMMFATFSPDGRKIGYVRENDLYVQDLGDLAITALTTNGSPKLINGTFDWVYEEELDLRHGFRWSPDSRTIAYWQLDLTGVREFRLINNTDGLYPHVTTIPYPKAGELNAAARVGVVNVDGGETLWMNVPGDPRNHYLARMDWLTNGTELILQQFTRLQNTNRVTIADARSGATRVVLTETDDAWVDNVNSIRGLDQGRAFLWLSERDGWRRVYRVSLDDGAVTPLTSGGFDVIDVEGLDEARGHLYLSASPDDAAQRHLYRTPLTGGESRRVTPLDQPGTHTYDVSPDGRWAIHRYSAFSKPPMTDLVRLPEHESMRVIEDNAALVERLSALARPSTEFFQIDVGDGILLDGWCVKPPCFDRESSYPVLFHVYGEPSGQNVRDVWRGQTALWHWMLAQQGYVVMSVDSRGTPAPRGRDWRKLFYGQVGTLAASDLAAAVRASFQRWPWIDSNRVAIWGWSGGGSMTLNALFRYPDLFHAGMAVAPVSNLRHYDTIYQERYTGLPEENVEGYRLGSPITHAHRLEGHLLLVHGTGDDNVHYQGTEALINELITHNKPFTMMTYPNRTHAIDEGPNTRRHLFSLLTSFLHRHLPVTIEASDAAD